MTELPNITIVCIDCTEKKVSALHAITKSIENINFGEILFFNDTMKGRIGEIVFKQIPKIKKIEAYSEFVVKTLPDYIHTEFCMIIQADGYIINPGLWQDEFLKFDYIGAPWWHKDNNVGNGGFSIRSKRLMDYLQKKLNPRICHPEDDQICRTHREHLESKGFTWAPEELASKFSFEPNFKYPKFLNNTFGFHGIRQFILS